MVIDTLTNDKTLLYHLAFKHDLPRDYFKVSCLHIADRAAIEFRYFYNNPGKSTLKTIHQIQVPWYDIQKYYDEKKQANIQNVKNDIRNIIQE